MKQKWEYKLLGLYHVNELCMINIKSLGVIIFCKSVSDYSSQVFCFVLLFSLLLSLTLLLFPSILVSLLHAGGDIFSQGELALQRLCIKNWSRVHSPNPLQVPSWFLSDPAHVMTNPDILQEILTVPPGVFTWAGDWSSLISSSQIIPGK